MAKSDNVIKLYDTVTIAPTAIDVFLKGIQDNVFEMPGESKPLIVDIIATHAGRPTRNNGLYLPQKMKDGAQSFVTPYLKPVLKHHNTHDDPIGRVIAAKYVDTSNTFQRTATQDMAIKALCNSSTSFIQSIRLLDALNDSALMEDPLYPGLGHILLTAEITDPEAIKKFLDKRYTTVSVGATTDKAVCSICKKDWIEDGGFCEHQPGKEYEGKMCRMIAGNLVYDEVSPVNVPADTLASVIALRNSTTIQNSVVVADYKPIIVTPTFRVGDSVGGPQMLSPEKQDAVIVQPPVETPQETIVVDAAPVATEPALEPTPVPEPVLVDEKEVVLDESDKHYEDMIELGWQLSLFDTGFEDAKLTPEKRKALSKSTFCKPNERQYPVNDCNHARVAMAYAKKNNESASVIACIRRKAASLGCPFSGKDSFNEQEIDLLLGLQPTTEPIVDTEKSVQVVKPVDNAPACPTCEESLEALKKELSDKTADFEELQKTHVEQTTQLKQSLAEAVVRLDMVAGQQIEDIQKTTSSIVCMSIEDLLKKLDGLKQSLQMDVVVAKINDGMANVPQGVVTDPTASAQAVQDPTDTSKTKNYLETYQALKEKHSLADARMFLLRLREANLVDRNFDPENI